MLARFHREVDWFPSLQRLQALSPDRPPVPEIRGLSVDSNGYLWIVATVPDAQWYDGLESIRTPRGDVAYLVRDADQVYDTIIEVIDVAVGQVVASARLPTFVKFWTHGEFAVTDRDATVTIERFELR